MTTTTQRSLALARKLGWTAEVVERWIPIPGHPGGGIRRDLYGALDILCCRENLSGCFGIQSCSASALAAHKKTAEASEKLPFFLAGNRFEIWAWAKRGERGKRKLYRVKRWEFASHDPVVWIEIEPFGLSPHDERRTTR